MRNWIILAASTALLTACSGAGSNDKGGKAESAKPEKMHAGNWEMTTQMISMEMAKEQSPEIQEKFNQLKATDMFQAHSSQACITEDEAKDPMAYLAKGQQGDCKFTDVDRNGNKVTGKLTCEKAPAPKTTSSFEGEFRAESMAITFDTTTEGNAIPGVSGPIKMKLSIKGKRLGDCAK